MKDCEREASWKLEEEGFVSRLPVIRRPVVDTHNQIPFVASVSDSY